MAVPVIIKQLAGVMNTDDSNDVMPAIHHKLAYNMRFRNGRAENIPGTRLLNNSLPTGRNECIGAFYDQVRQRIYYFIFNDAGRNAIYYYSIKLSTFVPIFICFANSESDVLNFSLNHPIASCNILYAPDSDGDILFWCDRINRPKKLNILDALNNVYTSWISDYFTVARPMPLLAPSCSYQDDTTVNVNNLRKKLYEIRYRWIYRNNEKSTCSPYSKLFAPQNPDDIATDVDPQKNNRIDAIIDTGGGDVTKIEVIARVTQAEIVDNSAVTTFSDNFIVATLVKADLSLGDNELYTYQFFNDQAYPFIDVEETGQLFDYVPKIANAQELLNGNVVSYGGILFGYDFDTTLDVTNTITQVANGAVENPFLIQVQNNQTFNATDPTHPYGGTYLIYMTGRPQPGDIYSFTIVAQDTINGVHSFAGASYTVQPTDTLLIVISAIRDLFNGLTGLNLDYHLNAGNIAGVPTGVSLTTTSNTSRVLEFVYTITYINPPPPASDDVNIACFHERSKYAFGLVYFDKYGVTNGVVYQIATMVIETPEIDTTMVDQPKIPAITFTVNHIPPSWAYFFAWVRTDSLTFADTWETVSDSTEADAAYGYIEITKYQTNTDNFPAYDFTVGDRVRIIGQTISGGVVLGLDFPVITLLTDPTINGTPHTGQFLKIPFDTSISDFGTIDHYSIEIYTPTINTDPALQVYFEFGQNYQVLNPTTVNRFHAGQTQNQSATQPAIFVFTRGDYYIRQRATWVIDPSVSDKYSSHISGTGRAFVRDVFAKETYFPTQFRWSLAYQDDTNINQTNRFYPLNFDEFDRAKGDIQRLVAYERLIKVAQSRYWGEVGVYTKFIQDSGGTQTLTTTDNIITSNNIQYYEGEYGVGDQYTGVVKSNNRIYFADPVRGELCRLSNDGITSYSALYKGQYYIRSLVTPYNKDWARADGARARILMCYDYFEENAITLLQGGSIGDDVINDYAFGFNEPRNGFQSFYDYHPEWMISAEDKIYSWKAGQLFVHDDEVNWTTFYGVAFNPSIKLVFNDQMLIKKKFNAVSYQSNQIWVSDTNGDINTSMFNQQTGLQQISQLKIGDYTIEEGRRYAALLFDANSMSNAQLALLEGDYLEGSWAEINYIYKGNNFAWIFLPYLFWEISQRNF